MYTVVSAKPQQTMPSVMADQVRVWVVGLVFTVITAGHWVLPRMWLVIGTFRLLASLWTLFDSHRVSSNGRRWEREHTPHLAVMCAPPDVRISVETWCVPAGLPERRARILIPGV